MNKIFCIDDDPVTMILNKIIITKSSKDINIESAVDGLEAINYYASLVNSSEEERLNYPELIFLDLDIPYMYGWDFLDEFIKKYYPFFPKTKVVILTSSINPKDEERARKYSIVIDFFSKPLTFSIFNKIKKSFELESI
jgi:CheY-like chemotaxis protein